YAPGHARVLADMVKDGQPWTHCPRSFLKRMAAEFDKEGFEVMASFENEFYLFKPTGNSIEPVDRTVCASTLAMDINRAVIDDIAEALVSQRYRSSSTTPSPARASRRSRSATPRRWRRPIGKLSSARRSGPSRCAMGCAPRSVRRFSPISPAA